MSKQYAGGPMRGPKGPSNIRTRSKTAPVGTVRKHFAGKFAQRMANIDRAAATGSLRRHLSQPGRMPKIERVKSGDGGNVVSTRRVSYAGMPHSDPESGGRKRSSTASAANSADTSQTGPSQVAPPAAKKQRRTARSIADGQMTETDSYCWVCHRDSRVICCELCPRVYHIKCLGIEAEPPGEWVCPECQKTMRAECVDTRSKAMSMITCDQLCVLLKYAVQRMKHSGSEPFQKPVDVAAIPNYKEFVVHPMDLTLIEKNIRKKVYGSTEALLADAKWIVHNCIIFNGAHHKLATSAKMVLKICRHEMTEIEICPDCYTNSCTKRNDYWFCVPCRTPHTLVWAKMKGYPFWPAKALREVDGQLDVRFFGEHDRAWVPVSQAYLLSRQPPVLMKNTRGGYMTSMDEVQRHIDKLKEKFGSFHHASYRTAYDSKKPYIAGKSAIKPQGQVDGPSKQTGGAKSASAAKDATAPSGGGVVSKKAPVKLSIVSKTASAVKSKYNSIITTRRAKALAATTGGDSGSGQSQAVRPGPRRGKPVDRVAAKASRGGRAKVSDSCRSAFEMSDTSAFNKVTTMRPLVSLTRLSPDLLRPLNGQDSIANKIESSIKKRDALEAADACAESVASQENEESQTEQTKQANVVDAKQQSGGEKRESGTEQMAREKSPTSDAKQNSCVQNEKDGSGTEQKERENSPPVVEAGKASTVATAATPERCDIDESDGRENAAAASPHETDSGTTPAKKNQSLESLVETCKAKLRENADESSSGDLEEEGSSSGGSSDSSRSGTEAEDGDKRERKDSGNDGETAKKDEPTTVGVIPITAGAVTIDPANPCNDKKEENQKCDTKSVSETADEKPLEADDKRAAVTPVDKAKSDAGNDQSGEKCSRTTPKNDATDISKDVAKPDSDTPGLEMEVNSISDSDCDSDVSNLVIDLNKERDNQGKRMTISVTGSAGDARDSAFVIDLDKDDEMKTDVKTSANSRSEQLGSAKKPVKFKSERQKEIERQQRLIQMSVVKASQSSTLPRSSANQMAAVKLSSSFPDVRVGPPVPLLDTRMMTMNLTQPRIDANDDFVDVGGVFDDVVSEKRVKENVEKLDMSKYSERLMMSVRTTLQDMYFDLVNTEATKAMKRTFQLELDKIVWQHRQQLAELKHNGNLTLAEMRASVECEKQKVITELRQKMEMEKTKAINETKKKQWCAYCSKEANFYCCWNTSYCNYPCQQAAWPEHMSKCTQTRAGASQPTDSSSGGISAMAGVESKPDLAARQTTISVGRPQPDQIQKEHQLYPFGATPTAVDGMNSVAPYASTLQHGMVSNIQPLQSVAQMPMQLRYPGGSPLYQQQYAPLPPTQMLPHGGLSGPLYSTVLGRSPTHVPGLPIGQSPGQLMIAPGSHLLRGPMQYRPPQGY